MPSIGLCVAFITSCGLEPPPEVPLEPLSEDEVVMQGVTVDRFEGGRLADRVEAERVRLERGREVVRGEQVRATRFADDGTVRAVARAPRGQVEGARRVATMSGGVVVQDGRGRVLETEAVTHDEAADRLHGEAAVTVRGADFTLEGQGFELRLGDARLDIGGPVRARVDPEAAESAPGTPTRASQPSR